MHFPLSSASQRRRVLAAAVFLSLSVSGTAFAGDVCDFTTPGEDGEFGNAPGNMALACGFTSPSHFSKCYRSHFNRTPYRERGTPSEQRQRA